MTAHWPRCRAAAASSPAARPFARGAACAPGCGRTTHAAAPLASGAAGCQHDSEGAASEGAHSGPRPRAPQARALHAQLTSKPWSPACLHRLGCEHGSSALQAWPASPAPSTCRVAAAPAPAALLPGLPCASASVSGHGRGGDRPDTPTAPAPRFPAASNSAGAAPSSLPSAGALELGCGADAAGSAAPAGALAPPPGALAAACASAASDATTRLPGAADTLSTSGNSKASHPCQLCCRMPRASTLDGRVSGMQEDQAPAVPVAQVHACKALHISPA